MARMTLFVLRSAYIRFKAVAAQIKAGIHPMMVSCRIRHNIPERTFPCNIKESQGRKKAKT